MKACVLRGIGDLVYTDVPDPVPSANEVLLKIKASGICGSDMGRVFKKGTYSFPTIPGHEFAGEIVATGEGADASLVGRAAAVFPLLPCFACAMCETGAYAMCRNYKYFGSRNDGGFAEYVAVPVWNLVFCDGLSFEELALAEPAAVSVHALGRAGVPLSGSVAIFGAGAIGLMLAAYAAAAGTKTVILLDIDDNKLLFAKRHGYGHVINNAADGWLDKVMELTGGMGTDVAIEGAGVSAAAEGCFRCAKPSGDVVLMGNPDGDMHIQQDAYWEILRKQLTVHGTWNSDYTSGKNDWRAALDMVQSKKVNLKPIITHKFPLSECAAAFDLLKDKSKSSCRVMFINEY